MSPSEPSDIPLPITAVIDQVDRRKDHALLPGTATPLDRYDRLLDGACPTCRVVNISEFDYGRAYRYWLVLDRGRPVDPLNARDVEKAVRTEGPVEVMDLAISCIAPFALIRFVRYALEDGRVVDLRSSAPFSTEQEKVGEDLLKSLTTEGIARLAPEIAAIIVPGVETELREKGEATVAHCIFFG